MAYIKNTWEDHVTPIDAQHMNHMEEGIEQAAAAADAAQAAADEKQPKGDYALKDELPAVPTKLTAFENDAGFITKAANDLANYFLKSETYSREEVQQLLSIIPKFTIQVVDALPIENISDSTVYLLASGEDENLYTEYIHVNGAWEVLGSQKVDLTGYLKEADVAKVAISGEWDDLNGKPFGYVATKVPVIEKTEADGQIPCEEGSTPIKDSGTYYVEIFGNTYECERGLYIASENTCYLGNPKLIGAGSDNGMPFALSHKYWYDGDGEHWYDYILLDLAAGYSYEDAGTIEVYRYDDVLNPIPTEYLPATVPVIPTATVGQIIVVKAVDADGKPTEWEAADVSGLFEKVETLDRETAIECAKAFKKIYVDAIAGSSGVLTNGDTMSAGATFYCKYNLSYDTYCGNGYTLIVHSTSGVGSGTFAVTEEEANAIQAAWQALAGE